MRIALPRGDIKIVRFVVNNPDGASSDIDFTEVYFTVKKTTKDKNYIFQKRLSTGGIERLNPGDYQVRIESEDTDGLSFGRYKFDIQFVYVDSQNKKLFQETFVGDLEVTEEVTDKDNE